VGLITSEINFFGGKLQRTSVKSVLGTKRRMTMKKTIHLTLVMLYVIILSACATTTSEPTDKMLKPGDKIGNMTVEKHSMSTKYPDIWDYCTYQPEDKEPGIKTIDCEVPLISRMQIELGWGAKDATILDSNWNAMAWKLYIDDYPIDLNEFGKWNDSGRPDLGVTNVMRVWILDLNNISSGRHTLRYLWTSKISIDDGFDVYAPGTYEQVVNFTVLEK
jgi:hypothetical protein